MCTQRRALKVFGVSLLALALGVSPSLAQSSKEGPCVATDAAFTNMSNPPSDLSGLVADCTALLAARPTMKGTAAWDPDGWDRADRIDAWDHVFLTSGNLRVDILEIQEENPAPNGRIAPELNQLTGLTELTLDRNEFTGSIPDISALVNLEKLYLQSNQLTGSIPDLSTLVNVEEVFLFDNNLTGSIPPLATLSSLRRFNAARQNLTGSIPVLSALSNLTHFNVEENRLSGPIPALGRLGELLRFDVRDNALTGAIPPLTQVDKLVTLNLGNDKRVERGFGNRLDGPMPDLSDLAAIENLHIQDVAMDGPLHASLNSLAGIKNIRLGHNRFTGAVPVLEAIGNSLDRLELNNNLLSGPLPDLGNLTGMDNLYLSSNNFTGDIPGWLDNMGSLDRLSLCFNNFTETSTLPVATESRRSGGNLTIRGCVGFGAAIEVEGAEGTDLVFPVTHESWPEKNRHGLYVQYRTVDQTATTLDYDSTAESFLTIPEMGADEFRKTANIVVAALPDTLDDEYDETFLVQLVGPILRLENPQGTTGGNTLGMPYWTATGTIEGSGPPPGPGPGPGPGPTPDPGPAPDPDPLPEPDPDPDPGPDPAACDRLVAPYWRGSGGIAVKPTNGLSATFRHTCRGAQTTETLYANEAGLIVQLLQRDACTDDAGKSVSSEVSVEGAEDGGWYWIDGARNAAVAPLTCEVHLGGARAAIPAGVTTDVTADATLFEHHASQLLGIVPHLQAPASGACGQYVAPYWKGAGGVVVSATDGESAVVTNTCGGVSSRQTLKANDAGLIVHLLGEGDSACTDGAGKTLRSDVSIAGVEPGGWYWLNGAANAAVAPLACADHLGGARATVPAGVDADATASATLFEHHVAKLIGIVPHLRRQN